MPVGGVEDGYVGQSRNVARRTLQHAGLAAQRTGEVCEQPWWDLRVGETRILETGNWTDEEMDARERHWIATLQPRYNDRDCPRPDRIRKLEARRHRENRDAARGPGSAWWREVKRALRLPVTWRLLAWAVLTVAVAYKAGGVLAWWHVRPSPPWSWRARGRGGGGRGAVGCGVCVHGGRAASLSGPSGGVQMQLVTFEAMLVDRLNAAGQVEARSFQAANYPALYGIFVEVDGVTVPFRLTKGSGTGDPPFTDEERALHDANVARLQESTPPRMQYPPAARRKAEDLIRDVLAADPPPSSVLVEGPVDGRDKPGVKIRFDTAAEIYIVPVA